VIFGPHMSNFREISRIFLDNKAAIQVKDIEDLNSVLEDLLSNREKNLNMSKNAMEVILNNADAIDRTMDVIMEYV
jgi:3-deoxy-D-manno-octulosonic-acid transferase